MKYFALALMAVLAISSVAMAEPVLKVVDNGTLTGHSGELLHSYLVQTAIPNVGSVTGLTIDGDVWQCNQDWSIYGGALSRSAFMNEVTALPTGFSCTERDTHVVLSQSDFAVAFTESYVETNTGDVVNGVVLRQGLGTFTSASDSLITFAARPLGTTLMQVVIPEGSVVYLNAAGVSDGQINPAVSNLLVPEPGTIALLIAGALCLLGIRRK